MLFLLHLHNGSEKWNDHLILLMRKFSSDREVAVPRVRAVLGAWTAPPPNSSLSLVVRELSNHSRRGPVPAPRLVFLKLRTQTEQLNSHNHVKYHFFLLKVIQYFTKTLHGKEFRTISAPPHPTSLRSEHCLYNPSCPGSPLELILHPPPPAGSTSLDLVFIFPRGGSPQMYCA